MIVFCQRFQCKILSIILIKKSCNNTCAFTLVYYNIKRRLADDSKRARQLAIKLHFKLVRKLGIKSFFVIKYL